MPYDPEHDWIEWHLTSAGWVQGVQSDGNGNVIGQAAPAGTVRTERWYRAPTTNRREVTFHNEAAGARELLAKHPSPLDRMIVEPSPR